MLSFDDYSIIQVLFSRSLLAIHDIATIIFLRVYNEGIKWFSRWASLTLHNFNVLHYWHTFCAWYVRSSLMTYILLRLMRPSRQLSLVQLCALFSESMRPSFAYRLSICFFNFFTKSSLPSGHFLSPNAFWLFVDFLFFEWLCADQIVPHLWNDGVSHTPRTFPFQQCWWSACTCIVANAWLHFLLVCHFPRQMTFSWKSVNIVCMDFKRCAASLAYVSCAKHPHRTRLLVALYTCCLCVRLDPWPVFVDRCSRSNFTRSANGFPLLLANYRRRGSLSVSADV